ncbi:MAG: penicillin-binding protein 2 [Patescibacteria group bacterium]|nr:penicillin-binding protein 2 [Patescibacteria group bacterium]
MVFSFKKGQKGFDIDNPLEVPSRVAETPEEMQEDLILCGKNKFVFWSAITIFIVLLLSRTFYLQVVKGAYYKDIAENNRIREVVIKAPRGKIVGQHGRVLAQNIPSFEVVFVAAHLPKNELKQKKICDELSFVIDIDPNEIFESFSKVKDHDRNMYLIKESIDQDSALEIMERSKYLPGIYIGKTARREYVDGKIFSHIIGYDGKVTESELEKNPSYLMTDYIGKDGLELTYEKLLHGTHGIHRYEVDSNNNIKEDLGMINPVSGDGLTLYVDAGLQRKITEELEKVLSENEDATGAVAIAVDPRSGGIRALVSLPSFDNNLFAKGIETDEYAGLINDKGRPLLNRAIAGEYPPGSIFKPFVAAAALQEGTITEQTSLNCSGGISVGAWTFPDWKAHGHTDVKKAIAESCDVFFYAVAGGWGNITGLNITRIEQYGKMFGFGDVSGVDLPGESNGNLPNESWKFKKFGEKWYIGDSYHVGIGQGYLTVTPLQEVMMTSMIANGGTLYRPQLVAEIVSSTTGERRKIEPLLIERDIISSANINIVKEGMRQTVTSGTGVSLSSLEVATGGKTGTSQFGANDKTHAWYVSFGPYEKPELAMVVLIEGGGEGHEWAVPVTKETYKWYFDQERGTINLEEEEEMIEVLETEIKDTQQ